MIFSENRYPPSDQVRGHAFPDHAPAFPDMFPSHRLGSCVGGVVRSLGGRSSSRERIMSAHESMEHAEPAEHAPGSNQKIELLIAVISFFLSLLERLANGAPIESHSKNVQ